MERLATVESELLLRWFLNHASSEQIAALREEMPIYFRKAWSHYVVGPIALPRNAE